MEKGAQAREGREEQVTKKTAGTEMTGKVICESEREEKGAGGNRKADRHREWRAEYKRGRCLS